MAKSAAIMTLSRQTPRCTGREITSTAAAFLAEGSDAGGRVLSSLLVLLVVVLALIRLIGGT